MSGDTLGDNLVVDVSVFPLQMHRLTECSVVLNAAYYGLSVCPLNSYVETPTHLHDGVWRQSPSVEGTRGSFLPFLSLVP